ncbi:MAG: 50S ribosomal protein L29 [Candidatus Nanohaloarchaeota archaeon]|nr:50S ribosomal protein L29 [Candidatus Nanohaloarchaeota archaeon]
MANKNYAELMKKSKDDLMKELHNTQKSLMAERAKITSGVSSENPSIIRKYKRNIARIKMILYQKYGIKL